MTTANTESAGFGETTDHAAAQSGEPEKGAKGSRYVRNLLIVLLLVNIVNYMDRSLIGILGESIKRDLSLSDTELGLLGGGMFTIIYSLFGIVMARLADRGWRKRVIMGSIMIWCTMTGLIGFASSFWQLALARIGVAIGEGGVLPASHALVSLEVDRRRQASAIGLLWTGSFVGIGLAALVGGWTHDILGWRGTFMIVGPLGLLLVPLIWLVMRNDRNNHAALREQAEERAPFRAAIGRLASTPTYRMIWLAAMIALMAPQAFLIYAGPYLIRSFGLSTMTAGQYVALAIGMSTPIGGMLGGFAFDFLTRRSMRLAIMVPGILVILAAISTGLGFSSNHVGITTVGLFFGMLLCAFVTAPTYAMAQLLAPPTMRSTSAAILNVAIGVIAGAFGPLIAGAVSDLTRPYFGVQSLQVALIVLCVLQAIGGLLFIFAGRTADADIERAG